MKGGESPIESPYILQKGARDFYVIQPLILRYMFWAYLLPIYGGCGVVDIVFNSVLVRDGVLVSLHRSSVLLKMVEETRANNKLRYMRDERYRCAPHQACMKAFPLMSTWKDHMLVARGCFGWG